MIQSFAHSLETLILHEYFKEFAITILSTFAGAWSAHRLAARTTKKERLLNIIKNVNMSITAAVNIFQYSAGLKKQHVMELVENFEAQRRKFAETEERHKQGELIDVTDLVLDLELKALPKISWSMDLLQEKIFRDLSLSGRPASTVFIISSLISSLNEAIQFINEYIVEHKRSESNRHEHYLFHHFGIKDPNGQIDERYRSYIHAVKTYTDDLIFYSKTLIEDIAAYGSETRSKSRIRLPKLSAVNFTAAEEAGLLPDEIPYRDWKQSFRKHSEDDVFHRIIKLLFQILTHVKSNVTFTLSPCTRIYAALMWVTRWHKKS